MRVYYTILVVLFWALGLSSAEAQSISQKIAELERREADGSHVSVVQQASVGEAVRATEAAMHISKINGYRVVIYFDNEQYASNRANSVLKSFKNKYPYINAYLVYESPYFKVSVGDCVTMEEAVVLLNTIIGDYPKAFPKHEEIKITQLQNVRRRVEIDDAQSSVGDTSSSVGDTTETPQEATTSVDAVDAEQTPSAVVGASQHSFMQ